jgi:hypothetical protein
VEVPVNSSDAASFPLRDNKWRATFPTQLEQGIAFILDPNEFQIVPAQQPFAIHDHQFVNGNPRQPLPTRANVTYVFDRPAEIAGVEVVQHQNGINGIDGFYGESPNALAPAGEAWSYVLGNRSAPFPDPGKDLFLFSKPVTASVFRIVIKQVINPAGYALYRVYPIDSHLQRYLGKN